MDLMKKAVEKLLGKISLTAKDVFPALNVHDHGFQEIIVGEPPEPDVVDLLAAVTDPYVAARVAGMKARRLAWLNELKHREQVQADAMSRYADQDIEALLNLYENYGDMDNYPEIQLPFFSHDAERVE